MKELQALPETENESSTSLSLQRHLRNYTYKLHITEGDKMFKLMANINTVTL